MLMMGLQGRTLLELAGADRRTRLGTAGDLLVDAASVDAALRGDPASSAARLQPVERRRAVQMVIEVWRDLARDLAVAGLGEGRGIRDLDQLDELRALAPTSDLTALRRFLDRLDRLSVAVEGYANPELVLDALLLTWPRPGGRPRRAA